MIRKNEAERSVTITPDGDLDVASVARLKPELLPLARAGFDRFVFDFQSCRFMCSNGLGLLVELYRELAPRGGAVRVENLGSEIRKLLDGTKLLPILTQEAPASPRRETEIEALDALQRHMSRELLCISYINNITSNILRADSEEDTHRQTLEGLLRSLNASRGMLLLVVEADEGRRFELSASEGYPESVRRRVQGLPLDPGGLEERILGGFEAHLFAEADRDSRPASPLIDAVGAASGILAPITGRQKALGLILIEASEEDQVFFPHSTPLLKVFANVCGLALEKEALLEAIKYKNSQLSRTLTELSKAQDSLMEAGNLAVAGSLIRGLGHALNNKLVPIVGYCQMLRLMCEDRPDVLEKVLIVNNSAEDIRRLVDNMRDLVRPGDLKLRVEDITEVADSALTIMDHLFRDEQIVVERRYHNLDGRCEIDRPRLVQAFLALFHRLPEAFAETRERRLVIELEREDETVLVHLRDNGRHIPAEDLDSLTDPLSENDGAFDTDRFNCSVAHSILRDHKGELLAQSDTEAGGACMTLKLPARQKLPQIEMIQV